MNQLQKVAAKKKLSRALTSELTKQAFLGRFFRGAISSAKKSPLSTLANVASLGLMFTPVGAVGTGAIMGARGLAALGTLLRARSAVGVARTANKAAKFLPKGSAGRQALISQRNKALQTARSSRDASRSSGTGGIFDLTSPVTKGFGKGGVAKATGAALTGTTAGMVGYDAYKSLPQVKAFLKGNPPPKPPASIAAPPKVKVPKAPTVPAVGGGGSGGVGRKVKPRYQFDYQKNPYQQRYQGN